MFTSFADWIDEHDPEPLNLIDKTNIQFIIAQIEKCPSTNRIHLQGYCECLSKKSMRLKTIRKQFNDQSIHVDIRRGNQEQAISYCSKLESRVAGPFEWGTKKGKSGKRSDLDAVKEDIDNGHSMLQIAEDHFSAYCKFSHAFEKYRAMKASIRDLDSKPFVRFCIGML